MSDYAVEVNNVSKKFYIGSAETNKKTLRSYVRELATRPYKRVASVLRGRAPTHVDKELWALHDINLKVRHGESIGIVGINGSGKSTLLQLIANVMTPTKGEIITRGHIVAMLRVGTGFHPELTGRENVYINASILGLSTKEIDNIYHDIVDFAEIEEFMDTPLKRYSSGMRVRLAFAVAINIKPEIIILDEVLAVGDRGFRRKSLDAMEKLHRDTTLIVASHNVNQLKLMCDRVVWIHEGQVVDDGNPDEVIDKFLSQILPHESSYLEDLENEEMSAEDNITLKKVLLFNSANNNILTDSVRSNIPLKIKMYYELKNDTSNLRITCNIYDQDTEMIVFSTSDADVNPRHQHMRPAGMYEASFTLPRQMLAPNTYYINIRADHPNSDVIKTWRKVAFFNVIDQESQRSKQFSEYRLGFLNFDVKWEVENTTDEPEKINEEIYE